MGFQTPNSLMGDPASSQKRDIWRHVYRRVRRVMRISNIFIVYLLCLKPLISWRIRPQVTETAIKKISRRKTACLHLDGRCFTHRYSRGQENQLRFSTPLTSLSFTPPPSTTPSTKRRRRVVTQPSLDEISSQQSAYQEQLQHEQHVNEEAEKSAKKARIHKAGLGIRQAGYPTLHSYLSELLTAEDPVQSSQISQLLVSHIRTDRLESRLARTLPPVVTKSSL